MWGFLTAAIKEKKKGKRTKAEIIYETFCCAEMPERQSRVQTLQTDVRAASHSLELILFLFGAART